MRTSTSTPGISSEVAELKDMVKALLLDKKNQSPAPTPVKAVEESCVTCGGAHSYQTCPATSGNVYRDNIQEYVSQAAAANYNQGNTGYRAPISNQIRPPGFPPIQNNHVQNQGNNQNRYNQNRGNFNQAPAYQPPVHQGQIYRPQVVQPPAYQAPADQAQLSNSGLSLLYRLLLRNFPSNIVTNPKDDVESLPLEVVLYNGPRFYTSSRSNRTWTESAKDTMPLANNGSTKDVPPSVVPVVHHESISELVNAPVSASMPTQKDQIHFLPVRNDERRREKANDQIEKFYEIFRDLSFKISFTDALMLMPKFASTLKTLIGNKEKLSEMARTPLNENCQGHPKTSYRKNWRPWLIFIPCEFSRINTCNALADLGASINLMPYSVWKNLSLPELTPTCMTLELADRSISEPIGIAEDVYVTVGKFQFLADFVVVDFEPDPRTFNSREEFLKGYKRIDVLDMACEEYSQEVLGFSNVISSGNPTPYYDLIVSTSSPTLTPFEYSDFLLFKEADSFLAIEDDPTSSEVDPRNYLPEIRKDLKICEANSEKSSVNEPPEVELKDLPPHLEYAFLEGNDKLPVIIAKDLKDEEKAALIKVLKSHKRAIAWKLSDIKGIDPEFCFFHKFSWKRTTNQRFSIKGGPWGGECIDYRKLNEATRKDHFPLPFMDQMLERLAGNQYYCFLDGFSGYFQIPIDPKDQEKTTFTCPYGTFAYRRMPFGLCNAPVFGDSFSTCLSHLEKMLKRCEDTNLVLNWEKSHFMVKEGIVLGHKISKSGIEVDRAKVDVIAKLPHPTTVKGVRSFLGMPGFFTDVSYKTYSKLVRPNDTLLEKETSFFFSKECIAPLLTLKKMTMLPFDCPDWDLPFRSLCDANDFGIGADHLFGLQSLRDGVTRLKEYVELTPAEAIQADCDIKAINIILQGLPTEIYALVSQHRVAKDLWEKIKLLMQGTSLTKQERGAAYDEFMPLDLVSSTQVLKHFLDEWEHNLLCVKLVKDLHTTNVDQLHAYLQQHERHANEGRQITYAAGTTRKYTLGASGSNTGKQQTVICYNCKGEGHIAKQCTKPKRKRDETWFTIKQSITHNAAYQAMIWMPMTLIVMKLTSQAVLMAKLANQALTTELDRYKEEVKDLKEMQNVENSFSGSNEQYAEIVRLKQNLFEQVQEKDSLMKNSSDLKMI
ncbi:reverse transcriptase domain-containing protein [Tanacetum coccineum]